ncbi:hypothetical protein KGF56_004775 [Candida oxycetoniae]|uniref:non-specific serine/threonine protein kinase n=1 Tax=Candida oxycetoniae TaxID=497107 RepID=A0AAI9STJ5_9ASCO|nr:uncharacterized protein KGF56_004775 [Candida oxycetoniae]KAI3402367.2 hypothetical protein KGF56_004775 [Candida oxycetoniae]
MEIPLKSRPKVSTVNLLDESNFQIPNDYQNQVSSRITRGDSTFRFESEKEKEKEKEGTNAHQGQSKLRRNIPILQKDASNQTDISVASVAYNDIRRPRRYSETEKNNFDSETGHRIHEDGKIRPQTIRHERSGPRHSATQFFNNTPHMEDSVSGKLYSRSHNSNIDVGLTYSQGLEDEYIPGLDFGDIVYRWNNNASTQDLNLSRIPTSSNHSTSSNTPHSNNVSYLDLNLLHAQVAPQPIRPSSQHPSKFSYTKLHDYIKTRRSEQNEEGVQNRCEEDLTPQGSLSKADIEMTPPSPSDISKRKTLQAGLMSSSIKSKKLRPSVVDSKISEVDYEMILNSLPANFSELPYSQRKKWVHAFSESIDYSQFSLFAKNYWGNSFGSSKTPKNGSITDSHEGSLTRRSRASSSNTLAGRLLARTSTTDVRKAPEIKPKHNVDEKGAIVLGYELGKIIGFGAWGTIRECTGPNGCIKAMKIVKSCRDTDTRPGCKSSPRETGAENRHFPKILEVFKKEIQIWKQLNHPNILPLIDYLETEDTIFCVMNRINGGTVFELVSEWGQYNTGVYESTGKIEFSIGKQRRRLEQVIYCAMQIVDALLYMHEEKGIVHGDLKLENSSMKYNDNHLITESEEILRSKSTNTEIRKPYTGGETTSSKQLDFCIRDDSRIGISSLFKNHGPSVQSVHLSPLASVPQSPSSASFFEFSKNYLRKEKRVSGIDSELPHSHIGSLPYASPELLQPCPPPLGPSADVWALGIMLYAMCVGRLPFQHHYEPRLRAMITAGQYNKDDLKKACLMEWILKDSKLKSASESNDDIPASLILSSPSMVDLSRQKQLNELQIEWRNYTDRTRYKVLYDIVVGCLETNITKRWDMRMIYEALNNTH